MLEGPGWTLIVEYDEWFCSKQCFFRWLSSKINEAIDRPAAEQDDPTEDSARRDMDEKHYADEYASDWPRTRA